MLNIMRMKPYFSKTIQNEIVSTVGAHIISKLSEEIRCSILFSVLADEAADVSNKENLSLVSVFTTATKVPQAKQSSN